MRAEKNPVPPFRSEDRAGVFPKRRQISANAVAWLESEIQEWLRARADLGAAA